MCHCMISDFVCVYPVQSVTVKPVIMKKLKAQRFPRLRTLNKPCRTPWMHQVHLGAHIRSVMSLATYVQHCTISHNYTGGCHSPIVVVTQLIYYSMFTLVKLDFFCYKTPDLFLSKCFKNLLYSTEQNPF